MKRLILRLGFCAALLLLIAGLCRALPRYRQYKQSRGMRQARGFLAAGDFANASVSARRVLQVNPRNVEACGFMARLAQLARSPSAIDWHRRIVEIDPTIGNRLELAACALRFEHLPCPLAAATLQ